LRLDTIEVAFVSLTFEKVLLLLPVAVAAGELGSPLELLEFVPRRRCDRNSDSEGTNRR